MTTQTQLNEFAKLNVTHYGENVRINWNPPQRSMGNNYDITVEVLVDGKWEVRWTGCEMSNDYAHTEARNIARVLASVQRLTCTCPACSRK